MTRFCLFLIFLAFAPTAFAQSGVVINSGEHATFSRLVFLANKDVTYKVISGDRKISVSLEGFSGNFDLSRIFDRIPKTRLLSVQQSQSGDRSKLTLNLACDCLGLAYRMNQYLVIDVIDDKDRRFAVPEIETPQAETKTAEPIEKPQPRQIESAKEIPPPTANQTSELKSPMLVPEEPPEPNMTSNEPVPQSDQTSAPRETESASEVAEARRSLMRQLELAAEQGFVALSNPKPNESENRSAGSDTEPVETALVQELETLLNSEETKGSVRVRRPKEVRESDEPPVMGEDTPETIACMSDSRLDPENWADDRSFNSQLTELRMELLGEFDQPKAEELEKLVKFYLHFGLAIEAEQLLKSYTVDFPDRPVLEQISDVLRNEDNLDASVFGSPDCTDRAGLWHALATDGQIIENRDSEDSILAAYGELPTMLRDVLATKLIDRLIENDRLDLAETLLSINERSPRDIEHELQFLKAKLLVKRDKAEEAKRIYSSLVAQNLPNHQMALVELGRQFLNSDAAIPTEYIQDVRAASSSNTDTELGQELFRTLLLVQATVGQLDNAFEELQADGEEILINPDNIAALAAQLFEIALDSPITDARLVETTLNHIDLMTGVESASRIQSLLAARMTKIGLPNLALDILDKMDRSDQNRLLASRALMKAGMASEAEDEIGTLEGSESRMVRALAKSGQGDFASALSSLNSSDSPRLLANLAWLTGEPSDETELSAERQELKELSEGGSSNNPEESDEQVDNVTEAVTLEEVRKSLSHSSKIREAAQKFFE